MVDAWRDYAGWIGKYVRVVQSDGNEIDGVLYCVDPETKNIVILRKDRSTDAYIASIILSHAMKHVQGSS